MDHGSIRWAGLTALVTRVLMLTGLMVAGTPTFAARATPASSTPVAVQQLAWAACDDAPVPWECTTLTVPLDYAQPDGEALDLAVTRLPAADSAHRIGVLLVNCGGPGCPAVSFLHQVGPLMLPPEILDRFDLVGWDARGVGASGQINCQPDYASWYDLDPSPDTDAEQQAWLAAGEAFAQACATHGGRVLAHMDTESVTSDMERLREALGEETISFLGLSYGTSLGARYADRYPEHVRALALDSGLPSYVDPRTFVVEWVDGIERAFNGFLVECGDTTTCAFSAGGDPGAAFDQLMSDLDAAPLTVETDTGVREVGQHAVLDAVDVTLSKPGRWPELASALAAAAAGDGAPVLALADQHNERNPDGSYGPGNTVFLAVGCLDFPIPRDPDAYRALAASLESGILLRHDGTGHPSYLTSACVEEAVNAYLLDLMLPPPDLVCKSGNGLFDRLR